MFLLDLAGVSVLFCSVSEVCTRAHLLYHFHVFALIHGVILCIQSLTAVAGVSVDVSDDAKAATAILKTLMDDGVKASLNITAQELFTKTSYEILNKATETRGRRKSGSLSMNGMQSPDQGITPLPSIVSPEGAIQDAPPNKSITFNERYAVSGLRELLPCHA